MCRINIPTIIFLICCLFGLTACGSEEATQEIFDNYLYRLSNSLKVKQSIHIEREKLVTYPKKPDILHTIPPLKVNILQFLQLSNCELQRLIGHKNSSLGKLMSGYHSMLYEYEFLVLAENCKRENIDVENVSKLLSEAIEHKKKHNKKLNWNAIFADEDVRSLFSTATRPITVEELGYPPSELINALEYLLYWLKQPTLQDAKLKQAFQTMSLGKYIGQLRLAMNATIQNLETADALVSYRLDEKPLCYQQKSNPQFDIVHNVFLKFYIGETQPLLAKIHQHAKEVLLLVNEIQEILTPTPQFTKFWQEIYLSKNSEWNRFNLSIETHTLIWQRLLDQCGFLPGNRKN